MKKLFLTLLAVGALALTGYSETNSTPSVWGDIKASLGNVTNWSGVPYMTYAPDAPQKWGGGVLAIYNVNNYVGAGVGVDWLGGFNLISGNVTLKIATHPLAFLGWEDFTATPWGIVGVGTPFSGAGFDNGNISTIAGAGLAFDLFTWKGFKFGIGGGLVNWTGADQFSGKHYQGFLSLTKGF